jgi:hypothetical protein
MNIFFIHPLNGIVLLLITYGDDLVVIFNIITIPDLRFLSLKVVTCVFEVLSCGLSSSDVSSFGLSSRNSSLDSPLLLLFFHLGKKFGVSYPQLIKGLIDLHGHFFERWLLWCLLFKFLFF